MPFGLAIYIAARTAGGDDATARPGLFLIAAVPAILLLTIAITLVPSQLAARQLPSKHSEATPNRPRL